MRDCQCKLRPPTIYMDPIKEIFKKVKQTISRYRMTSPGDLCIVAVSGGPDSVCLLHILHELEQELGIKLVVAHYDHGLREAEDEAETQFVQDLASSMNLPFETERASFLRKESTSSLEEKARNARYGFLERLKDRLQAQKIAVGHNLNDQTETILMRLLRGSGPPGLAGIPPHRDNMIIRPLIETKRDEIEAYLTARELSYVIDSSNLETRYLRNRIRLQLLPSLLEYQPRLLELLGKMAVVLREDDNYLQGEAEHWLEMESQTGKKGEILIPVSSFSSLPLPLRNRVTRNLIMRLKRTLRRIDQSHIESVYDLALSKKPQGSLDLPDGLTVKRIYDKLAFTLFNGEKTDAFHYLLQGPGTFYLDRIARSITLVEMEGAVEVTPNNHEWTAYLDADKLQYPLVVRNFRPGDRFVPLGMTGQKKIKDYFIDLKIPSDIRASIPLLISQDTPVWICGHRIDDRFKVTSATRRILKVTLSR